MALSDTIRIPQSHIELSKDGTTVKIDLVNTNGEFDEKAIQKDQQPRLSIKMAQGGTKHSDYEPPYASQEQRDWSGGRGNDDFDLDETRYMDSFRAESWREGQVILGPRASYGTGYRNADSNIWPAVSSSYEGIEFVNLDESTQYRASQFTTTSSYTAYYVGCILRRVNTYTTTTVQDITIALYDDNGGEPGTEQSNVSIGITEDDIHSELVYGELASPVGLSSSTAYWVVMNWSTGSDVYQVGCKQDPNGSYGASSDQGGGSLSWESSPYEPYYRVTDDIEEMRAYFFRYCEALMAWISYRDGSAPKLFINGDYGQCTTKAAAITSLVDNDKTWTTNQWKYWTVILFDGEGSDIVNRTRVITANTSNTLTVSPGWDRKPDETTTYAIIGGDAWYEITGHGINASPITDVLAVNQLIYTMRNDNKDMVRGRYPGLTTPSSGEWVIETGNRGRFLTVAADSLGRNKIWKGRKSWVASVDKADPVWGSKSATPANLDFNDTELVTNGSMEADSDWANVGDPTTNEQSDTQAYAGTYSRHVVCDDADEGIDQDITTTAGDFYRLGARIYVISGSVVMNFDGTAMETVSTTDTWIYVEGKHKVTTGTTTIEFLSSGGAAEYYVDDVTAKEMPTYLRNVGYERITGMIPYGDPERLWVATTGGLYMEDNGDLLPIPLREFHYANDERNGFSMLVHDVYLYISFLDGLERYYKGNLDDVGYNRDEGLPYNRRGNIKALAGYPGRIYAAVSAWWSGYDSILLYNGVGWHEVYRHSTKYDLINQLYVEPIPGNDWYQTGPARDRLWFSVGGDLMYVDVDLEPTKQEAYRYHWESWIETSWMYYQKKEITKYYDQIKIFFDRMASDTGSSASMGVEYMVDDDTGWRNLDNSLTTANGETISIPDWVVGTNVTGSRIKFRFLLRTDDMRYTPIFRAFVLDFIEQIPTKDQFTFSFLAQDDNIRLQGKNERDRIETDLTTLESWLDDPDPATIASQITMLDGKEVKILSMGYRPFLIDSKSQKEQLYVTMTVMEV